jgi:hypothetical protein
MSRKLDDNSIKQFKFLLSYENWEEVFSDKNVNTILNNFLNTYLRIFYTSFPLTKVKYQHNIKPWLTTGIRISCANKRKLYLRYRNSTNMYFKNYYKKYCKILTLVIKAAKKQCFNKLLLKSNNRSKTTWNVGNTIVIKILLLIYHQ